MEILSRLVMNLPGKTFIYFYIHSRFDFILSYFIRLLFISFYFYFLFILFVLILFRCTEPLFYPTIIDLDQPGLVDLIANCITQFPAEEQQSSFPENSFFNLLPNELLKSLDGFVRSTL